jgi:hypothetical protein
MDRKSMFTYDNLKSTFTQICLRFAGHKSESLSAATLLPNNSYNLWIKTREYYLVQL